MTCKEGYESDSPLCAVCEDSYYPQLGKCVECTAVQVGFFVLFIFGLAVVAALIICGLHYYGHLINSEVVANCKILISFVTVESTVNTQFGVQWPPVFLKALAALSAFTFDLSALSSIFCLVKVSFFENLVFNTLSLVVVIILCYVVSLVKPEWKQTCTKTTVYLLLFAYPVVSVKVVEAFSCHDIDGARYLRADYTINCDSSQWRAIAGYASLFLIMYVAAFPLLVLRTLYQYGQKQKRHQNTGLLLGFLLGDYRPILPCLMWDGIGTTTTIASGLSNLCIWLAITEMVRKLLLSVIGAFWSSQSPLAIGTALLLATFFLCLHLTYRPFKANRMNLLQTLCLVALSLLYFAGLVHIYVCLLLSCSNLRLFL
jgi:hypothetical protein